GKFKCCTNKSHANFFCVICYNVFHTSCMERMQIPQKIGEHTVLCSGECINKYRETNKNTIEKPIMELKISQLLDEIRSLREQMVYTEEEKEKEVTELQQQINNLEISDDKNKQLKQMKRLSVSFENDVFATEQNYEQKLKDSEELLKDLNKSITSLGQKNSDLQQELTQQVNMETKYTQEITALKITIDQLKKSMKLLQYENKNYLEEIDILNMEKRREISFVEELERGREQVQNEQTNKEVGNDSEVINATKKIDFEQKLFDRLFIKLRDALVDPIKSEIESRNTIKVQVQESMKTSKINQDTQPDLSSNFNTNSKQSEETTQNKTQSKFLPQGEPKQRKDYAQAVSTLIRDSPSSSTSKPRQVPEVRINGKETILENQNKSNQNRTSTIVDPRKKTNTSNKEPTKN
ncbi:hypothetical protein WA026_021394, partial [Henosepilachna vigintioctopunctata]